MNSYLKSVLVARHEICNQLSMISNGGKNELKKYLAKLGKLSFVKRLILETLWTSGEGFPKAWVSSQKLLTITKQKYFDRRVRELNDELGCNIETKYHKNDHAYRLISPAIKPGNPRHYLTATQKTQLFIQCGHRCQVCNKTFGAGVKGLQADHKIPLIRGGSQEQKNWQALCNACNVTKRSACAECSDDCNKCAWAFPEKLGPLILVRIPKNLAEKARAGRVKLREIERMLLEAWEEYEVGKKSK